jgi:hypothetical protein
MDDKEYWEQGTKHLDRNIAGVKGLIDTFPDPRGKQVLKMMNGPVGEAFFEAPASTKRIYHCCYPGGLLAHSLNVVLNAVKLAQTLAPGRWPDHKVVFCALFHDLGKAGDGKDPYYVQTKSAWKAERGENYEINSEKGYHFMPSSELGLYVLAKNGIDIDREEYLAIRLNDGPAADGNSDYAFREPDLAVLINMADNWAMRREKAEDR